MAMIKVLLVLALAGRGLGSENSTGACRSLGDTCSLDGSPPGSCCEKTRCWEYMSDSEEAALPGLTCVNCIAEGAACSKNVISGTPCCSGFMCGGGDGPTGMGNCTKTPELVDVVDAAADDDTNSTKCGCPEHEYCPGPPLPNPNGHCSWLGAEGFACGNPKGSKCAPDP